MKTSLVFAALAGLFLASCSSDAFLGEEAQEVDKTATPINFGGASGSFVKATATGSTAANLLGKKFVVYGANSADNTTFSPVFDNYNVTFTDGSAGSTKSNTTGWEYVGNTSLQGATQGIKYWDKAAAQYKFVAVSGLASTEAITNQDGFTVAVDASNMGNVYFSDRVTVLPANYNKTVTMSFRRLTAQIRVGFYETVPGYAVKDVKFYYTNENLAQGAKVAARETVGLGCNFPKSGSYKVSYGTDDVANAAFKNSVTQRFMEFGELQYTSAPCAKTGFPYIDATGEPSATAVNAFLGTSSTTATYGKGSYTIDGVANTESVYRPVLPQEYNTCPMFLNVNFTLVPLDGSKSEIKVYQASAVVPVQYCQWKPNYSYTYLFKISDKVGGTTGTIPDDPSNPDPTNPNDTIVPTPDPTDPTVTPTDPSIPVNPNDTALYPITFDAVVVAAEDGNQQTITTVSTPSITTHAEGSNFDSDDEYTTGTTVELSTAYFTPTAWQYVYSATEVTEKQAEANDALNSYTWLTATDAKFQAAQVGWYVVRMTYVENGKNKYAYKVVKVQ